MDQLTAVMLSGRLARLERENRRWRRATGAAVFVGLALAIGVGARDGGPGDTLDVKKIILRGDGGVIRGELGVRDDGVVAIALNDAKGEKRLGISALAGGTAGIGLYDSGGMQAVQIYCAPGEEGSGIALNGDPAKNINHMGFGIRSDGEARFAIAGRHADGVLDRRACLVAMPDGRTYLEIQAGDQLNRAMLMCRPDAEPGLFFRKDGGVLPPGGHRVDDPLGVRFAGLGREFPADLGASPRPPGFAGVRQRRVIEADGGGRGPLVH